MGEGQPASRHWDCNARESADVEGLHFAARREKLEVFTGPGSGAGVRLCGEGCDAPQPPATSLRPARPAGTDRVLNRVEETRPQA